MRLPRILGDVGAGAAQDHMLLGALLGMTGVGANRESANEPAHSCARRSQRCAAERLHRDDMLVGKRCRSGMPSIGRAICRGLAAEQAYYTKLKQTEDQR